MASIGHDQRFTKQHPCPICAGHHDLPRGDGRRCFGFLSDDGLYAHCTREEHAGVLAKNADSETFAHLIAGQCGCGVTHDPAVARASKASRHRRKVVARYDYRDEGGQLLYQVERLEPKNFRQRQPDGAGGWIYNLKGVRRVLYRLPELLAAPPGETVYIVEGEKDADALAQLGLVATTNPGGAGKWRPEFCDFLKGHRAVALPDNDQPGKNHDARIAASLVGLASSIKVVELPGLPPKGDVSDWLHAGGARDKLLELSTAAPEWSPAKSAPSSPCSSAVKPVKKAQAQEIVDLVSRENVELFHTPGREGYAAFLVDGHRETWPIRSRDFSLHLRQAYHFETDRAATSKAVTDARDVLEARALFDGPEEQVYVRVAPFSEGVWLDFADQDWRAVKITHAGWEVVDHPGVHFRRARGMRNSGELDGVDCADGGNPVSIHGATTSRSEQASCSLRRDIQDLKPSGWHLSCSGAKRAPSKTNTPFDS